jgi:hypothetical protein
MTRHCRGSEQFMQRVLKFPRAIPIREALEITENHEVFIFFNFETPMIRENVIA